MSTTISECDSSLGQCPLSGVGAGAGAELPERIFYKKQRKNCPSRAGSPQSGSELGDDDSLPEVFVMAF